MKLGIKRVMALLLGLTLLLAAFGGSALAQADKPSDNSDTAKANPDSPDTVTMPNSGSTSSAGTAWAVTNSGTGRAGYYLLNNTTSTNPALQGDTKSTGANAAGLYGSVLASKPGSGAAGVKGIIEGNNSNGYGLYGLHRGSGMGVYGQSLGAGGKGVTGINWATSGAGIGLNGQASAINGYAGFFRNIAAVDDSGSGGVGIMALSAGAPPTTTHTFGFGHAAAEFAGPIGVIAASKVGVDGGVGLLGTDNASSSGYAIYGYSASSSGYGGYFNGAGSGGVGVRGLGSSYGVYATGGSYGVYSSGSSYGLYGSSSSSSGIGVRGVGGYYGVYGSGSTYGVYGSGYYGVTGSGTYRGVTASGSNAGVFGSSSYVAVWGEGGSWGTYGTATCSSGSCYGAYGSASGSGAAYGVWGQGGAQGVHGTGVNGVVGVGSNISVQGEGGAAAIYGRTSGSATAAIQGINSSSDGWAGYFDGKVHAGSYTSPSAMTVRADDPLDASKYLDQAGVVAGQQLGLQNGNVRLNDKGEATVTLPAWYGSIYGDYRYVLTPIGDAAVLYISKKVQGNSFSIGGGKPGMEVSWQVSGVRNDKYAMDNPFKNEILKSSSPAPKAQPAYTEPKFVAPQGVATNPKQPDLPTPPQLPANEGAIVGGSVK